MTCHTTGLGRYDICGDPPPPFRAPLNKLPPSSGWMGHLDQDAGAGCRCRCRCSWGAKQGYSILRSCTVWYRLDTFSSGREGSKRIFNRRPPTLYLSLYRGSEQKLPQAVPNPALAETIHDSTFLEDGRLDHPVRLKSASWQRIAHRVTMHACQRSIKTIEPRYKLLFAATTVEKSGTLGPR